ncbi:MAG: threonine ammonia-lyase [Desulfurococcales archaeon]|nr:threonine ammonia-lyase [Desulfurococcales archaeon]
MGDATGLIHDIARRSREASEVIREYIHVTPLEESTTFSKMAEARVLLKYENLQKTGAFKARGALYKVYKIKDEYNGVVAASAGNHAQGVAYAGRIFNLKTIIVMPEGASISKIEATKNYGAEVILAGRVYDETLKVAKKIAEEKGYALIHAFDDPDIIAGQGTIALELLEQMDDFEAVVAPIGGGGLISGLASVLKTYKRDISVYGVEPSAAPKTLYSLKEGRPVTIEPKPTIADGLVVKRLGTITFQIIREAVDGVTLVEEDELAHTIYLLLERGKVLAEGAGAAALAAMIHGKIPAVRNRKSIAVVSGGNIDLTHIYRITLRGLAKAGRLAKITGFVPDAPGQLKTVLEVIASHRGNVIGIFHDRTSQNIPAWSALVSITVEVPGRDAIKLIIDELRRSGYEFWLSD